MVLLPHTSLSKRLSSNLPNWHSLLTSSAGYTPASPPFLYLPRWITSFFVVQLLSHVWLFATPWTTARQASLSFTISQSLLKLMSVELMMPSNHLILCRPLLFLPSILLTLSLYLSKSKRQIFFLKDGLFTRRNKQRYTQISDLKLLTM